MNWIHIALILVISFLSEVIFKYNFQFDYLNKVNFIGNVTCDLIQTRAQGGSTRDVHDQVYSFLRKNSPNTRTYFEIQNGNKVLGNYNEANSSNPDQFIVHQCLVENSPDYKLTLYFPKTVILDLDFIEGFFFFVIGFILIYLFMKTFTQHISRIWANEVILKIRSDFGLNQSNQKASITSIMISKLFVNPLIFIKNEVQQLNQEISSKNQSLAVSQKTIEQQNELIEKAKLYEEKVNMVRHDLKSPLSSLKFAVYNKSNTVEVLPEIIQNIEKIVSDLEQTSNLDASGFDKNLKLDVLEVLIKNVINQKKYQIQKNIKFEFNFPQYLSVVKVNTEYFERCVANLIQNSIEAIESDDGKISITVSALDQFVEVSVADNGKGIQTDNLSTVFEKGYTFGKSNGNGLGLHFVKNCITSWGGKISVTSEVGIVTSFTVKLPVQSTSNTRFLSPELVRSEKQFVLIDDESKLVSYLWGHKNTICISDPQQFTDWWENEGHNSDLPIVVDFHFSKHISGIDILREIGKRDRVYLSTSDYLDEELLQALSEFGVGLIPKQVL